jgi:RNA polymerase sigma-70 factor (ECF subfamily)
MEQGASDIALFNRIKMDDRLALNTLFTSFYARLCRFACTCALTPEQAEEIVSDVFFNLWKNRDRIEIHTSFRSYLYKAVKNAALAVKKPVLSNDFSQAEQVADPVQPALLMEYDELNEHFNRTVNALPERCRQVFIMSRFEGMKYREISVVLGISEKTIEHHIVKALDVIRESVRLYQEDEKVATVFTLA